VVRLTHHPGRTISGKFISKTAVLGVAEPGRVARRFQQYVETFQVTPKDMHLFVNYNTWWTLMPPTETNCIELIELFKRKLFDPYGESFDTFTIDEGWDNKESIWEIRPDRFPRGFAPLLPALKTANARLGLWLSPSSGYGHAPWGGTHGYERNSHDWFLCQSGPNYRRDITKAVTKHASDYGLAFYKFDGFSASCDASGHGHLPGAFAKEANVDAFIELQQAARAARPGIFLDPTCGIWLSPWWLKTADSLWGSVSGDYPDIIVPGPITKDSATTTRDAVFRQRCRQHPGYPPSAIEHLGIVVITPEKWEDDAMAVVGRGCRLLTLYINPKMFQNGNRDWAFLAALLKWTRHNAATLRHTELIGGDPFKREAYGFAHGDGRRGIVSLRNPFIEPQTVTLRVDDTIGLTRDTTGRWQVRLVYPREEILATVRRSEELRVKLQAYEQVILHIEPVGNAKPILAGARCGETGRDGSRIAYTVYGRPGQKLSASLAGAPRLTKASLDGEPVKFSPSRAAELPLRFAGELQTCEICDARLAAEPKDAPQRLAGRCVVQVPASARATMHVLCDPPADAQMPVSLTAQVNGKTVKVRAVESPKKRNQAHTPHPWTWFEFDVPAGRSEVEIRLAPAQAGSFLRANVGGWLWLEHSLTKATLALEFAGPLPVAKAEPMPMPLSMNTEREILTVHPLTRFRLGTRWLQNQSVVHLDEVAPDESSQEWGKLQKNQSVWQKPMVIAGRKFARGLGTHANSRIGYDLTGGKFQRFHCFVGRDEHSGDGRVVFEVHLDGKTVFNSGPMTRTSAAKEVDVSVAGAKALELHTLDGGDGISGDHGDWAEPRLVR